MTHELNDIFRLILAFKYVVTDLYIEDKTSFRRLVQYV